MNDAAYRKRLAADLPVWRERGWLADGAAEAILASVEVRRSTFGMAAIVGTLGALLIGLGIIAFVSSNWEEIPRFWRFLVLVAGMGVAYLVAALLAARDLRLFADAALLAAGLIFAASIALVGQTYHLSGEFAGAVLLFIVGTTGAALFTGSTTLTVIALAAGGYWTWLIAVDGEWAPHWGGLVVVLVGGAIATWLDSAFGRVAAIVALGYWIAVNLIVTADTLDWPMAGALAVLTAIAVLAWAPAAILAALDHLPRLAALGRPLLVLGLFAILLSVGVLQVAPQIGDRADNDGWVWLAIGIAAVAVAVAVVGWYRRRIDLVDLVAVAAIPAAAIAFALWRPEADLTGRLAGGIIVIAAAVWAINLGQSAHIRGAKGLGLTAFGIEVVYLYAVTFGTLMETALAFLTGGVLFVALAFALYKLDRRLARAAGEAA